MTNLASVGGQSARNEKHVPTGRAASDSPTPALVGSHTGGDDNTHGSGNHGATDGGDDREHIDKAQRRHYRVLRVALAVIRLGPVLILAGLVIAMTLLSPVFLTTGNVGNVLSQTAAIAVLAIGQLMVILTRGIDLSVGSTLALASVLGAIAYSHGSSGAVVIIVMLATGAAVGFVNGAVYVWGRLPHPFIITLATLEHRPRPGPPVLRAASPSGRAEVVQHDRRRVARLVPVLGVPRARHRLCSLLRC